LWGGRFLYLDVTLAVEFFLVSPAGSGDEVVLARLPKGTHYL
jgi:hypothetical protein